MSSQNSLPKINHKTKNETNSLGEEDEIIKNEEVNYEENNFEFKEEEELDNNVKNINKTRSLISPTEEDLKKEEENENNEN